MIKSIFKTSIMFLFMTILLNGCSSKPDLVGKWIFENEYIAFADDGTYSINSGEKSIETGIYSIKGRRLEFIADWTNGHNGAHSCEFEIDDDKLTLNYEDETVTLIKHIKENVSAEAPRLAPKLYISLISEDLPVQRVQTAQLTTSWSYGDSGYESDSPHVLQLTDFSEITLRFDSKIFEIELQFSDDYPPYSVSVKRWNAEYAIGSQDISDGLDKNEAVVVNDNIISVSNDGNDYVYEVYAKWAEGSSYYGFRTEMEHEIKNDALPVIIIQSVASNGLSFLLENSSDKEYQYSSHYALDVRKNDTWELAEPIIDWDWVFTDEGYSLPPNATTDLVTIDWQLTLGELPSGEYRFRKEVLFLHSPGDFDKYSIEKEFFIPLNNTADMSEYIDVEDAAEIFDESTMPGDFYFVFESGGNPQYREFDNPGSRTPPKVILDTKNNIIAKDNPLDPRAHDYLRLQETGMFGYFSTEYYMSDEDLREIYSNIIKYNVMEFNSRTEDDSEWAIRSIEEYWSTMTYHFRITFCINGKLYTVLFDTTILLAFADFSEYEEQPYADLISFVRFLWDFYTNTEEYQSFPEYEGDW